MEGLILLVLIGIAIQIGWTLVKFLFKLLVFLIKLPFQIIAYPFKLIFGSSKHEEDNSYSQNEYPKSTQHYHSWEAGWKDTRVNDPEKGICQMRECTECGYVQLVPLGTFD